MAIMVVVMMMIVMMIMVVVTPLVNRTFQGNWWIPLLGVLFLPLTVMTYALVTILAGCVSGWNWLWVLGELLVDLGVNSYPTRRGEKNRRSGRGFASEIKD